MQFTVTKIEKKSADWYILSLKDVSGTPTENVSVNRVNQKQEVFPNFDAIVEGYTLEATLWISTTGKNYLFAPKPSTGASKGFGGANIAKAQETKAKNIEKAQDNKELGIKTSSTIRMAVDLAIAEFGVHTPDTNADMTLTIKKWRTWLLNNWDIDPTDTPPFN